MVQDPLFEADDPDSHLSMMITWDEGRQRWQFVTWHTLPGHPTAATLQRFDAEDWSELLSSLRFELTVFWDETRTGAPFVARS